MSDPTEVTLEVEGTHFPEGAQDTALSLWECCATAHGDDGRQYWINCSGGSHKSLGTYMAVPFGAMDMWDFGVSWEKGRVVQSPKSVYKIAYFPQVTAIAWHPYPSGTLTIKRSKDEVAVDLGDYHIICNKNDETWHFSAEDAEKGIKAEWVHTGVGFPTWYGDKEKVAKLTTHNIAGGYFWSGRIEGTLTIEGRKVGIKGKGVRNRFYSVETCVGEVGGWEEWMWFHFNEMFGSLVEFKLSRFKKMSLYLVDEKQYFEADSFNVEHHDWAYYPPVGLFIPTRYKTTIETEAGILEMEANTVGCTMWGATGEVPDIPIQNIHWDKVDGTFTSKDGRKRTLTNGMGGNLHQQWKPYPTIFQPEVLADAGEPMVVHLPEVD